MQEPNPQIQVTDNRSLTNLAKGFARLVWWEFRGCSLSPTELRHRAAMAGLNSNVPDINPLKGLKQAVREFKVGRHLEAVIAHQDDNEVTINILELIREGKKARKTPVTELVWDVKRECWTNTGNNDYGADKLVERVYMRQNFYDGNAVRDFIVMPALAASHAATLRRGMYFVMTETEGPLAKAQKSLEGLDTFTLNVCSVDRSQGWEAPMASAADAQMRDELGEIRDQIDNWRKMASRVRSDSQATVLARFDSLRKRAEVYSQALEVSLEDLRDDIEDMEKVALQVIDDKEDGVLQHPAAATPPKSREDLLREAVSAVADTQLHMLFSALCDGDMPEDRELIEEAVVLARLATS